MHTEAQRTWTSGPVEARPREIGPPAAGLAARMVLTLAGAAALMVGPFLTWFRPLDATGVELSYRVFWQESTSLGNVPFLSSAGFVVIALGLLVVLGLAFRAGWLTSLAGLAAIAGFALYLIVLYRAVRTPARESLGMGPWLVLGGGILAVVGGFLGSAHRVMVPVGEAAPAHEEEPEATRGAA
jgi:hypothetical protein